MAALARWLVGGDGHLQVANAGVAVRPSTGDAALDEVIEELDGGGGGGMRNQQIAGP